MEDEGGEREKITVLSLFYFVVSWLLNYNSKPTALLKGRGNGK